MKKCLMIGFITLTIPMMANAETKASCFMDYQNGKHGYDKRIDIFSDHSYAITNTTGKAKTYHIEYRNSIMFQNPYYVPNASKAFDIVVENGATVTSLTERINHDTYISMAGTYPTQAITMIKLDGKIIKYCEHNNVAVIF